MEFWLGGSSTSSKNTSSRRKRGVQVKGKEKQIANYAIHDHGALAAATLSNLDNGPSWCSLKSRQKGNLCFVGKPRKSFPITWTKERPLAKGTLNKRAEQGVRYVRSHYPDVDIPFEIFKDAMAEDETVTKGLERFDPYFGNILEYVRGQTGAVLAFAMGNTRNTLNISPFNLRGKELVFRPTIEGSWTFDTPILQLETAMTSQPGLSKGSMIAVRTYGEVSLFDVRTHSSGSQVPDPLKKIFDIGLPDIPGGRIMDISICNSPLELLTVTSTGEVYRCYNKPHQKFVHRVANPPDEPSSDLWRVSSSWSPHVALVSSKLDLKRIDMRVGHGSQDLFKLSDNNHSITSLAPPASPDLPLCVSTTNEVLWIDERYAKRPLLGWRHYRKYDRMLRVRCTNVDEATLLTFLWSPHNGVVTAFSLSKSQSEPAFCEMPACAFPQFSRNSPIYSSTVVRHPKSDVMCFVAMSDQGSLHQLEMCYRPDAGENIVDSAPTFGLEWTQDVACCNTTNNVLGLDVGQFSVKDNMVVDMSGIRQHLFMNNDPRRRVETSGDDMTSILELMSTYWRRENGEPDYMRTTFDAAFALGNDKDVVNTPRSEYPTGTPLSSTQGYHALTRASIPVEAVRNDPVCKWHFNLSSTLQAIDPRTFSKSNNSRNSAESYYSVEDLMPYILDHEDTSEAPLSMQRETEAAEKLAVDLALAGDIFSSVPFRDTRTSIEGDNILEQEESATSLFAQMSLGQREPPAVKFGYLKPTVKDPNKHYRKLDEVQEPQSAENEVELSLGVRLLLTEWEVGTDPAGYVYADPYGQGASGQVTTLNTKSRSGPTTDGMNKQLPPVVQSSRNPQAPPTIVPAAKRVPPVVKSAKQPVRDQERLQVNSQPSAMPVKLVPSQVRPEVMTDTLLDTRTPTQTPSSQPAPVVNTQVVPGPFGGRPAIVKKKPPKKRIGGF